MPVRSADLGAPSSPARSVEGVDPETLMSRSYRQFQLERGLPALEERVQRLEVSGHPPGRLAHSWWFGLFGFCGASPVVVCSPAFSCCLFCLP